MQMVAIAVVCTAFASPGGIETPSGPGVRASVASGQESVTVRMLLGGALVVGAMYLVELTGRHEARVTAEKSPPSGLLHHEV